MTTVLAEDGHGLSGRGRDTRASSDEVLRAALLASLLGTGDRVIVEEMAIAGTARVDVASIGTDLRGFEIKSERDSLRRLPAQIDAYSRVFDYVTLVVDSRHLRHATDVIPDWWGVKEARHTDSGVRLVQRRRGRRNTTLDPSYLVSLLWRDEALLVLSAFGLDRGARSKNGIQLRKMLVEQVPTSIIRDAVRSCLLARKDWRPAAQ